MRDTNQATHWDGERKAMCAQPVTFSCCNQKKQRLRCQANAPAAKWLAWLTMLSILNFTAPSKRLLASVTTATETTNEFYTFRWQSIWVCDEGELPRGWGNFVSDAEYHVCEIYQQWQYTFIQENLKIDGSQTNRRNIENKNTAAMYIRPRFFSWNSSNVTAITP